MANQVIQRLEHGNLAVAIIRLDGQDESVPEETQGYWKFIRNENFNPPPPEHDDINRPPDEGFSGEDDPVLPDQEDGAWAIPFRVDNITYRSPDGTTELDPSVDLFTVFDERDRYKLAYQREVDKVERLQNKLARLEAMQEAS